MNPGVAFVDAVEFHGQKRWSETPFCRLRVFVGDSLGSIRQMVLAIQRSDRLLVILLHRGSSTPVLSIFLAGNWALSVSLNFEGLLRTIL